MHITQAVRLGK